MKKNLRRSCLAYCLGAALLAGASASAGTFSSNFNSLQFDPNDSGNANGPNNSFLAPAGTLWGGSISQGIAGGYDLRAGGTANSGVLKLVNAVGGQNSSFVVGPIDMVDDGTGTLVPQKFIGFDMTFQLLLGGGNGADGFSVAVGDFPFAAGTDPNTGDAVPNNAGPLFGEEGPGTIQGLTVSFDIYNNSPAGTLAEAPAIDLKWNGVVVAHRLANPAIGALPTTLQSGTAYWPVKIHLDPDGTIDVIVNNVTVFGNYPIWRDIPNPVDGLRFGFGARTGGSTVNAWIDDLNITTTVDTTPPNPAVGQPYLVSMTPALPIDQPYSALGGVTYLLQDSTYSVNPSTIKLLFDTTDVTAKTTVTRVKSDPGLTDPDQTLITYFGNGGILPSGLHTATLSYSTTSTPAANNSFVSTFTLSPITAIPASYKLTAVDESKPGFKGSMYQMDRWRSPGDQNITPVGERQVAHGFIDPTTHQPYPDVSTVDPTTLDPLGYFDLPDVLNFEQSGASAGQINANSTPSRPESLFPGIPGNSTLDASMGNFAMEFHGYLKLKAGGYRFGLFADDRFRFSFGNSFDAVGTPALAASTGANADTIFDVIIPEDGYYPFRCSYWEGGGGASFEFYWINPANNQKVLVNDPEVLEAPRAYSEAPNTRPWVKRVLPVENWVGAFPNEKVLVEIVDGPNIGIDDSSIKMQINDVDQTITKTRSGRSMLVERPGSDTNLLPSGGNTVRIIYNYSENGTTVSKTNQWFYQVAPYYNAVPVAAKVAPTDINTGETGFNVRYTQMDRSRNANQAEGGRIGGNGDGNRMPNPEIQLAGGELNPTNGLAYPNIAFPGPNNNFTDVMDVINFNNATVTPSGGTAQRTTPNSGFFSIPDGILQTGNSAPLPPLPGATDDVSAPGLPATQDDVGQGTSNNGYDNYVAEFTTYLQLTKGVHVFGMNSDDGFVCSVGADPHDTLGSLLGFFTGGRGNKTVITDTEYAPWQNNATTTTPPVIAPGQESGSSLFSVIVPEDGIYPIRLLYWNGGGGVNAEFYTVDQESGTYLLINDLSSTWGDGTEPANRVPAYRTYTGPAKEWVKFSISPNPWDNRVQQSGPGPIVMYGRTVNNAQSSDIYNWQDVTPASSALGNSAHWADVVIGAIVANAATGGTADSGLKLLLDGAEVPATKTVNGTDVTIAYKPNPILASGSTHQATLVYAGLSNSWSFKVQNYATLNAADKATGAGDPAARGFSIKLVQSATARTGGNTAAAAEAQLGGLAGQADVSVPGPETGGRYIIPGVINFSNNGNNNPSTSTGVGNFQKNVYGSGWPFEEIVDSPVPGLTGGGAGAAATREQFTAEIFAYLEFPTAGYYRLGGNVDDGMVVKIGTPGVTNGMVLFTQDRGAGAADIPFSIVVPQAGLYPVRFVWYQGTGGAQAEFFSYDENGNKIPINDATNPNAIKAYYQLQGNTGPTLTVTQNGANITITWAGGGELETATDVTGPWAGTGNTTGTDTEPATTGTKFFRVKQ